MRCTLAALCDFASTADNGKINILGAFTALASEEWPVRVGRFTFAGRLELDESDLGSEISVALHVEAPDGEIILVVGGGFTPQKSEIVMDVESSVPIIIEVAGILLKEPGDYRVRLVANGTEVASLPLAARTKK